MADEVCEAAQVFGCYFKSNGKTLEVVLETRMSSPALWIKEGLIILLIQDVMLQPDAYIQNA